MSFKDKLPIEHINLRTRTINSVTEFSSILTKKYLLSRFLFKIVGEIIIMGLPTISYIPGFSEIDLKMVMASSICSSTSCPPAQYHRIKQKRTMMVQIITFVVVFEQDGEKKEPKVTLFQEGCIHCEIPWRR